MLATLSVAAWAVVLTMLVLLRRRRRPVVPHLLAMALIVVAVLATGQWVVSLALATDETLRLGWVVPYAAAWNRALLAMFGLYAAGTLVIGERARRRRDGHA